MNVSKLSHLRLAAVAFCAGFAAGVYAEKPREWRSRELLASGRLDSIGCLGYSWSGTVAVETSHAATKRGCGAISWGNCAVRGRWDKLVDFGDVGDRMLVTSRPGIPFTGGRAHPFSYERKELIDRGLDEFAEVAYGMLEWDVAADGRCRVDVIAQSKSPGLQTCPLEACVRDGPEMWLRTSLEVPVRIDLEVNRESVK